MIKFLNIKIIIIIVALLVAFHLGVGLFVSPLLKPYLVNKINQYSKVKLSVESVNFWPLTISVTLKDLKVSEPDDANASILQTSGASGYISLPGLLKKQLILSRLLMNDARISLKKDWITKEFKFLKKGTSGEASAENNAGMNSKEGNAIVIDNARIEMRDVWIVPADLVRLAGFNIAGDIKSNGIESGGLRLDLRNTYSKGIPDIAFDLTLKDVDLKAIGFIYQDSLPVEVLKGDLDLDSKVRIINGNISSENSLSLRNHELAAKEGQDEKTGFMPLPLVCNTLNRINPVNLNFEIGGTVEKPEFKGFQKSLMALVMSNTQVIQEQLMNKGFEAIGEYFKKKKKKKESEEQPAPQAQPIAPTEVSPEPQSQPQAQPQAEVPPAPTVKPPTEPPAQPPTEAPPAAQPESGSWQPEAAVNQPESQSQPQQSQPQKTEAQPQSEAPAGTP